MARILLVEDDPKIGRQVVDQLGDAGFHVDWIQDGQVALERRAELHDLWIVDLMLPGVHGLDVLKNVRRESDVPVLVLSARSETGTIVRALELGADDFVQKPFWPEELMARVQARLRRPLAEREGRIEVGPLEIDLGARRVVVDGTERSLTALEFDLLAVLARRRGTAVQRASITDLILPGAEGATDRALDVHVSRLRKKLAPRSECIETVWGVGYRFNPTGFQ